MVHSFIYYELNTNIWSDDYWDEVAKELLTLEQKGSAYEELFKDFDGSTGMQLAAYVRRCGWLGYVARELIEDANKHN